VGHIDLDRLPDATVVVGSDGTVDACNDRAEVLLGLDRTAIGRPFAEVLDLRADDGRPCSIGPAPAGTGRSSEHELTVVQRGGLERCVSVLVRWQAGGGFVLSARPSGRRRARERVSGEVVAMVSHEIRAPLTSVKGFTRTLLQRWDRFSDEQKQVMLATIDQDADRLTRLLRDLLEVSRIDAGRVKLQRAPIDLVGLARETIDRIAQRDDAQERDIRLDVSDELPRVHGDADRLEQVLANLLENALREAPDGAIEVSLAPVHDAGGAIGGVELAVRDHGPGIPEPQARTIFRKFSGGRDGDHRTGTGLGLYISRGLVEAHGGTITLDRRPRTASDEPGGPGEGACFRVRLPLRD
jgi:signal transduction histidine kinase